MFFFFTFLTESAVKKSRAYKTKVQVSLDLIPEQIIFKNQQKLDNKVRKLGIKGDFKQCPI